MCRRSTHPANCTPNPACSFWASFSIATPNLKILKQGDRKKGFAEVHIGTPLEQVWGKKMAFGATKLSMCVWILATTVQVCSLLPDLLSWRISRRVEGILLILQSLTSRQWPSRKASCSRATGKLPPLSLFTHSQSRPITRRDWGVLDCKISSQAPWLSITSIVQWDKE